MSAEQTDQVPREHGGRRHWIATWPAVAAIAFAFFYIYFAFRIRVPLLGDELGPRFFPLLLGGVFLILGILYFVDLARTAAASRPKAERTAGRWRVVLVFVAAVAYTLLLSTLGYIVATILFVFVLLMLVDPRPVLSNAIYALLMAGCFYLVFSTWLGIELPTMTLHL